MAVSETWATDDTGDVIQLDGYHLLRNDRGLFNLDSGRDTRGGGVALYIHDSLKLDSPSVLRSRIQKIDEVEFLFVKVFTSNRTSCLLGVVYRPPNGNDLSSVFEALQSCVKHSDNIIIAGDFNCHFESENRHSRRARELFLENQLHLVDSGPTFFRSRTPTWLDAVIVDGLDKVTAVKSSGVSFLGGHDYVYIEYKLEGVKSSESRTYRDFRDVNHFKFQRDLSSTINTAALELERHGDINSSYSLLRDGLLCLLDRHAPFRLQIFGP